MDKIQTINEINRLHNEWIPKNFNKGMGINYETLNFYSWLRVSQPNFFSYGTFKPENSYQLVARVTANKRRQHKEADY